MIPHLQKLQILGDTDTQVLWITFGKDSFFQAADILMSQYFNPETWVETLNVTANFSTHYQAGDITDEWLISISWTNLQTACEYAHVAVLPWYSSMLFALLLQVPNLLLTLLGSCLNFLPVRLKYFSSWLAHLDVNNGRWESYTFNKTLIVFDEF